MKLKMLVYLIVCVLIHPYVYAGEFKENVEIQKVFESAKINGTFVVLDMQTQKLTGYNEQRATTQFIPASTFKIANALIGLSNKVVKNVDEILPYGGGRYSYKQWERDMGLKEAIAMSNVPIFQELARRIGLTRMANDVVLLNYGNHDIGLVVDRFWLDGPLKISAVEQVVFLGKLARDQLPLPINIQKSVKDIIEIENTKQYVLYGKTGWQNAPGQGVGWWVGFVSKQEDIYAFALNIDMYEGMDPGIRIKIAKESLSILGIL